jgi:hypothetical protein
MQHLKDAIVNSSALISINYSTNCPVFLAVDSSLRGVGWILSQECTNGKRRPSRFSSISWNECESNYSQPKIELYGLFRALRALRLHIIGVCNLVVKMDAVFICGMLNNPDVHPNAVINHWIAAILLFNFKLVHVPAEKHQGPDGLSRCEHVEGEDAEEDDLEEWIDKTLSLSIWASYTLSQATLLPPSSNDSSSSLPANISVFSSVPNSTPSKPKLSDALSHLMLSSHSYSLTLRPRPESPHSPSQSHSDAQQPFIQPLSSECSQLYPLVTRSAAQHQLLSTTPKPSMPEVTQPDLTNIDHSIEFPSSSKT